MKHKTASIKGYTVTRDGVVYYKGRKRSPTISKSNYYRFNIRINGINVPIFVHRLQAYQKFGDRMFNPGIVVRHLDGNSLNNH